MAKNYTIMLATHRPHLEQDALLHLQDHPSQAVRGNQFPSCSKLWNECIARCPTERVIICNEKARPSAADIEKLNGLLDQGYGLAGLYLFGFFGFDKELIRRIGFFDERYVGGWYEDNDFCIRLWEADIAGYYSRESAYLQLPSSWEHDQATSHFKAKWRKLSPRGFKRILPEENYEYPLGDHMPREFLPFSFTRFPLNTYECMYPENPARYVATVSW